MTSDIIEIQHLQYMGQNGITSGHWAQ